MELLNLADIDKEVGVAFGKKPTKAIVSIGEPEPKSVDLTNINPELKTRLDQASAAWKQQTGKDLPITSGARTRAEQENLFMQGKSGKPGIYSPINPANMPGKEMFHTDAADISTKVPESFLNQFGIHRPLGKNDPVHAVIMPGFKSETTAPQLFGEFNPENITSAVQDAFKNPEPTKQAPIIKDISKIGGKVTEFLRGQGQAAASLADTLYGVVPGVAGMATYAGARAVQSPEEAAQTQQKVVSAIEQPFGKAFGVTETPGYKGEASRQIMNFIGENMGKGAEWIAEKTGMPKTDVEYYMNLAGMALPGVKGTKVGKVIGEEVGLAGQAVKQGIQAVTPEPVQRVVGGVVEKIAPGTTNIQPKPVTTLGGQPQQIAPYAERGRPSIGAAGLPDATIIKQALQTATPEFQQLYGNMPLDKVNTPVVLRHLEADSLPIPIRLTEGMATGDLVKISREQNLRGKNTEYAYRFNEINKALVDNVPAIREKAAPDVYAPKTIDSSNGIIEAYKKIDSNSNAAIEAAGTKLKEAAGGDLPVDAKTLKSNIDKELQKELLLTDGQGISQYKELVNLAEKGEMTFDQYLAMRRNLSKLSGTATDGNVRFAAGLMVRQLDQLPLIKETAVLKPLADARRNLAKKRFDAFDNDPAYKAAVFDTVSPDKFFDKYVIGGHNKNVNTMIDTLGRDSLAHQHIKAGTINWLSDKAGIVDGQGNFSQANYNKAIKRLDDVNNFGAIFDPETGLQLKTLGNVANYSQFQPRGSFVNNSNTLVGYLAEKAAGGLEATGNVIGLKTLGYPIGSEARRVIQSARERSEVKKALEPGAGSTLQDIKNKGK
jgi:hypothetical protein